MVQATKSLHTFVIFAHPSLTFNVNLLTHCDQAHKKWPVGSGHSTHSAVMNMLRSVAAPKWQPWFSQWLADERRIFPTCARHQSCKLQHVYHLLSFYVLHINGVSYSGWHSEHFNSSVKQTAKLPVNNCFFSWIVIGTWIVLSECENSSLFFRYVYIFSEKSKVAHHKQTKG